MSSLQLNINKQSGLTLVELMIASLLGMLLIGGVIQLFIGTRLTYNATENVTRAQENGRFAIDVLAKHAKMAGAYQLVMAGSIPNPFPDVCVGDGCTTNDADSGGTADTSDIFAPQYVPTINEDCNGLSGTVNGAIRNVFWVQDDNNGISSLYCRGYDVETGAWIAGSTAQPYISGIDSLQILYGESDGTGNLEAYRNADQVVDWANIKAVKIAVLAQSGLEDGGEITQRSYTLLDGDPIVFQDNKSRYVFTTSIFIRNSGG